MRNQMNRSLVVNRRIEIIQSYAMIACSVIGLALFVIYPLGWILKWCTYRYNGILDPKFIGMENFKKIFSPTGYRFWQSVGNTFIFSIGKLAIEIPLALVLACFLSGNRKGTSLFRTIYFLPSMLSVAVIGIMFYYIFGSYSGVVNSLIVMLGGSKIDWFTTGPKAMLVTMFASIWQNFGINMLFFMTGLQSIPNEMYEAAAIDGAKPVQRFFRITIPMLGPVMQIVIMNALLGSLKVTDLILSMTNGSPNGKTEMMMSYIYKQFFSSVMSGTANNYGYAAACTVIVAIILTLVTLLYLRLTRKSSQVD
ncbi:MAG: sugar ABC transporter permease [Candidatus Cloacimonetes bacterium]|nr:sugar ABC transporter permease [Candidatus Cloacimonadota bacterium]